MTVYLVGAGPGDPGLLTRRGATLLSEADVVLYDRLIHHSVLALAPETAELIDVGKRPDGSRSGTARQDEINRLLVEHGQRSHTVVRLKGGDPFLFGRGGEEAEVLTRAAVRWEIVPGVSSAFGVPAAVGIPVTHRGLSSAVTVVTGQIDDSDPEVATRRVNWELLAKLEGTLVVLMGMANRADIAADLQRGGKPASTPTAVIERGTTPDQVVVRTTLGQLADVPLGSPAVIVIGPVAELGAREAPFAHIVRAAPAPLSGRTVVVTRSGARALGLVRALHGAGAETIEVPLTEQTGPADGGAAVRRATSEIRQFRWVIVTSANAVPPFMAGLRDARSLGDVLVAAVGPATADALRQAGVEPDLVPVTHSAAGLMAEFPPPEGSHSGRKHSDKNLVLFPCGDLTPSTIPEALLDKGWEVRRVEAYRTVALPSPEAALLNRMAAADAVTFTAGSSATAYAALKNPDGTPLAVPPLVVCMGPTTAKRARALGMPGVDEADDASTEGVVAALIRHLAGPVGL